jgi:hypothetical protein
MTDHPTAAQLQQLPLPPTLGDILAVIASSDDPNTAPPDDPAGGLAPPFTPVPVRARHDGWTPDRQRKFIHALAVMGVVARAAKAVGVSATAAYKLRDRADAAEFAAAWDLALTMGRDRAFEVAIDRATNGITVPRFYRGRQVGTRHRYDYRLALAAINQPSTPPARRPE